MRISDWSSDVCSSDLMVKNEGNVEVGGFDPYSISYRCITPKRTECTNLLVPVCLSTSHIAFGSVRMEPAFMILGESAAVAAVHAIDERSEERRVGKECVSECRSRWSPDH